MTHLRIEQSSNVETVSMSLIQKLYETALATPDTTLAGNLLCEHCKLVAYEYLTGSVNGVKRFPDLSINVTDGIYISFEDPDLESLLSYYIGDDIGVTMSDALNYNSAFGVNRLNTHSNIQRAFALLYSEKISVNSFNEFLYFTGVTSTNTNVFKDFYNLTSIICPLSLTTVGLGTFQNCSSLTNITGLSNVTTLGELCFASCTNLSNIDIDWSKITFIGSSAFSNCTSLTFTNLAVPNLTSIKSGAFLQCTGLQKVTNLGSCTSIEDSCFYGCTNLTEVTIPSTVTTLKGSCFRNCTNLTTINLPLSITTIGGECFKESNNIQVENINLPNLQTLDANGTFSNCKNIKHIVSLGNITSLNKVYEGIFSGCTGLLDAVLPESLTSINTSVFVGCTNLNWIKILSTTLPTYTHSDNWNRTTYYCFGEAWTNGVYSGQTYPIYVKDNLLSQYQSASGWSDIANRLKPLSQFATDFPNG